jgi:hypothetical protein
VDVVSHITINNSLFAGNCVVTDVNAIEVTNSTLSITRALKTAGRLGIVKDAKLVVLIVTEIITATDTIQSISSSTGNFKLNGGIGIAKMQPLEIH